MWELTDEEALELAQDRCSYCGTQPKALKVRGREYPLVINGIDRKDNKQGYTKENCVTCCCFCNFAKYTRTEDEFKEWIERLVEWQWSWAEELLLDLEGENV